MRQLIILFLCGVLSISAVLLKIAFLKTSKWSSLFWTRSDPVTGCSLCRSNWGGVCGGRYERLTRKGSGKGKIIRLIDEDNDGVADSHTLYTMADSARGLISLGTKLWVLHTTYDLESGEASGMDLTLFEDENWDGFADGPGKTLIKGICSPESIRARGTDHSTNGIRMGIDGWIYIAVGDFGFSEATGTDGLPDFAWRRNRSRASGWNGDGALHQGVAKYL